MVFIMAVLTVNAQSANSQVKKTHPAAAVAVKKDAAPTAKAETKPAVKPAGEHKGNHGAKPEVKAPASKK